MKKGKQLLNTHDFIDGSKVIIIWDMIQEKESEGILVNEDDCWFVCQNDFAGDAPEDTHGYSYGWNIGNFWNDANNISSVKHIYLAEEEKQDKSKIRLEHIEFVDESFVDKINRLIDTVNELQEEAKSNARTRAYHEKLIDTLVAENNIHEKQIDELQMKVNKLTSNINFAQLEVKENVQADPYAEQRKWIGKVCRFFDSDKDDARIGVLSAIQNGMYFIKHTSTAYDYCEPVKPDEDIIYKGE